MKSINTTFLKKYDRYNPCTVILYLKDGFIYRYRTTNKSILSSVNFSDPVFLNGCEVALVMNTFLDDERRSCLHGIFYFESWYFNAIDYRNAEIEYYNILSLDRMSFPYYTLLKSACQYTLSIDVTTPEHFLITNEIIIDGHVSEMGYDRFVDPVLIDPVMSNG